MAHAYCPYTPKQWYPAWPRAGEQKTGAPLAVLSQPSHTLKVSYMFLWAAFHMHAGFEAEGRLAQVQTQFMEGKVVSNQIQSKRGKYRLLEQAPRFSKPQGDVCFSQCNTVYL